MTTLEAEIISKAERAISKFLIRNQFKQELIDYSLSNVFMAKVNRMMDEVDQDAAIEVVLREVIE